MIHRRGRTQTMVLCALMTFLVGCPQRAKQPEPTSQPASPSPATTQPTAAEVTTQPSSQPAAEEPRDPNRVMNRIRSLADPQDGWLRIEGIRADTEAAWASATFEPQNNKIVIETDAVEQFSIDLAQVHIDWGRRVILRIDGRSSELTRKKRLLLHLRRSPAGAWEVTRPE